MSLYYDCSDPVMRKAGVQAAISAINNKEVIVMPTDTVYGVGCNAFDTQAVRALFAAKNRSFEVPIGVLVSSWQGLDGLVIGIPDTAKELVHAFWPGGLSIIVNQAPSLIWDLGDSRGTVMVRMPGHPVALQVLSDIGPMAVSSANISGKPPATTIDEASEQLGELVSVYLDAGTNTYSTPSTIIDFSDGAADSPLGFRILRQGAVSMESLADVLSCDVELLQNQ